LTYKASEQASKQRKLEFILHGEEQSALRSHIVSSSSTLQGVQLWGELCLLALRTAMNQLHSLLSLLLLLLLLQG
jgi:hypothetical protein